MSEAGKPDLTTLTVQLLSAYVSNNAVPNEALAGLIRTTRAVLAEEEEADVPAEPAPVPAVSVKASLASKDQIISLIDGKPYKTLKRHLSGHGLTPEDYRARYKLPANYPMVAANYSEQRRRVAKELGLGRKKADAASEQVQPEDATARSAAKRSKGTKRGSSRRTPVA